MSGTTLLPDLPAEAWPAVSIYIPTERAAPPAQAGATRLRNALGSAERRLAELGFPADAIAAVLRPARGLLGDLEFWQHQQDGLALFLAPDLFKTVHLPFRVPELTVAGQRFHIRPLLPLATGGGRFHILALSARFHVLYDCTRDEASVALVPGLPRDVRAVGEESLFERTRNYAAGKGGQGGGSAPVSHAVESPEETRKAELIEYLRRIDSAVTAYLKRSGAPLVLAAEPEILGQYRTLCSYPRLLAEAIRVNPFALEPAELHRRGYALLEAHFRAPLAALKEQILARLGSGEPRVSLQLPQILAAAEEGRVSGLLLAAEAEAWGRLTPEGVVGATGEPSAEDEDLLNRAAAVTLGMGGEVHVLPRSEMPRAAVAAAAFRY